MDVVCRSVLSQEWAEEKQGLTHQITSLEEGGGDLAALSKELSAAQAEKAALQTEVHETEAR